MRAAREECVACDVQLVRKHRSQYSAADRHAGRNLCQRCYDILDREGWLEEFPRAYRRHDDLMDDWAELRDSGVMIEEACRRLGIARGALDRARQRAVARGDARGHLGPYGRPFAA